MLQRQLLQPLLQPNMWQGAVAASATASSQLITGLSAVGNGSLSVPAPSGINWRGLAADATTADAEAVPWSSGVAGSSTTSSSRSSQQRQGAPNPRVLRPDMYAQSFRSPVKSLQSNRGEVIYLPQLEGNMLGRGLLTLLGAYSRKQTLRNGASVLYQGITEAAENTQLQEALGLEVGSFMVPFNLLSLHMWLIINRMHQEPDSKDNKFFLHTLYHDYFYKDMERRVYKHGVQIRVGKWVDRLQKQFYGTSFAYDKAIRAEGGAQAQHAALVGALVKNMYNADASNQPWAELTARYLFRELACLDQTEAAAVYKGHVRFSDDVVKR